MRAASSSAPIQLNPWNAAAFTFGLESASASAVTSGIFRW